MGNKSSKLFLPPVPVEYGPGIIKTFSVAGPPASYIQIRDNDLKQCLQGVTDQNTINECISQNVLVPSTNGAISSVNLWSGEQLPPNPACNFVFQRTAPQKSIVFAGAGQGNIINSYANNTNKNSENFETETTSQNNILLLIIVVITLLVVFTK